MTTFSPQQPLGTPFRKSPPLHFHHSSWFSSCLSGKAFLTTFLGIPFSHSLPHGSLIPLIPE